MSSAKELWRDVTGDLKRRFEEEDVDQEDIEDAIEHARSE